MQKVNEVKMVEFFNEHWYKILQEDDHGNEIIDYFPSVTTKLSASAKPFLAKWRGDIGNREADLRMFDAAERGSRIHHGWYTLTTGGEVIYNPWRKPNFSQEEIKILHDQNEGNLAIIPNQDEMYDLVKLQEWFNRVQPKVIGSEMTCYNLEHRDAGTIDNVMEIEGGKYEINGSKGLALAAGTYIVDLKTGKAVDDDAFMQMAAYAKAYESMGCGEITGALIIHTGAQTKTAIAGLSTIARFREEMEQDYADYRAVAQIWERKNKNAKPKVFEFPAQLKLQPIGG